MTKLMLTAVAIATGCLLNTAEPMAGTSIRVGVVAGTHRVRPVVVARHHHHYPVVHRHGFHTAPAVMVPRGNFGRVDFNVKPKSSRVYVDGAFIGTADDWNGGFFGTTATLRAGTHRVRVVAPDGRSLTRTIYVMPGKELNFDFEF